MTRLALTAALAATLLAAPAAEAGKPFRLNVGGVQVNVGHRGGGVNVRLPGGRPPIVVQPPVIKPPVVTLPHPPIVVHPKPPVICPPPIIKPKPPIVLPPPIVCPKPPIVVPPPVIVPKPPVICPPPVVVEPPVVCPPPVLKPVCPTLPCGCTNVCHCQPQPEWRFGMACERVQSPFGVGMRVVLVTPAGPAQQAGLKQGDVLLVAGSVNLSAAESNDHGVTLIQAAVPEEGILPLTIIDAATGQLGQVTMAPERIVAAPVASTVALNPAEPTAAL